METKLVRITTNAEAVALQYSSSVSKGIIEMHSRMGKPTVNVPVNQMTTQYAQQVPEKKLNWIEKSEAALSVTGGVKIGEMSEKEFWKKMSTTITASLEPMVGKGY